MEFKNFNSSVGSQKSSAKRPEETSPAGNKFSNFHKTFNVETVVETPKKPVEKVTTPIQTELPQGRTIDLSINKPSVFDKAKSFVGKITSSIGSWYSDQKQKGEESSFKVGEIMKGRATIETDKITGKKTLTGENISKFNKAQAPEEKYQILDTVTQEAPIMKFLNSEAGKKVTGKVQQYTSDIPLKTWARIKSIGDDTYDEAKSALIAKKNDPNNSRFEKILYGIQDSGVQSAIGALLSVGTAYLTRNPRAGQAVSLAYFAPISAESQRQEKGQVKSLTNIAIDTVGDTIISGFAESALKNVIKEGGEVAIKEFVKSIGKGFLVEGTTEPAQTFLKYANDYRTARTKQEKNNVVAKVVDYVKSGAMVDEFLIGGISGAGITGIATGAGKIIGGTPVEPTIQPKKPVIGKIDKDFVTVRDEVDSIRKQIAQNPENTALTDKLSVLQDQLDDYQQSVKNRPIYISDDNSDIPLATIETVQYPDGKFASRITANIPNAGANTNFLDSKLYNTEKEAIESAKSELNDWIDVTRENVTDQLDFEALDNIKKGIEQPENIEIPEKTQEKEIFYSGSNGKVIETDLNLKNKKVLELSGDQREYFGVKTYPEADRLLIENFGDTYDIVKISHPEMPQKADEYYNLSEGKWYTKDKTTAEIYAMQNRGAKYEKGIAVPPKKEISAEQRFVEKNDKIEETKKVKGSVKKYSPEAKQVLLDRVSDLYRENLKNRIPNKVTDSKLWVEQMQEQIEDPERYSQVSEDDNPKGIKIGDKVRINGEDEIRTVTSVNYTAKTAPAYIGGFSVHTISPASYGVHTQIADVEKIEEKQTKKIPEDLLQKASNYSTKDDFAEAITEHTYKNKWGYILVTEMLKNGDEIVRISTSNNLQNPIGTLDEVFNESRKYVESKNEYATTPNQTFYHGTLAKFDKFDLSKAGENTEWDNAKWGFFFIDDKARAEKFVEDTRPTGDDREANIMEVQLDIKNPIDLTIGGITSKEDQAQVIYEILNGEKAESSKEALELLDENIDLGTVGDLFESLYSDVENKKIIQKAGYDGIVSEFGREDGKTILEYVAFEPSQIKIKGTKEDIERITQRVKTQEGIVKRVEEKAKKGDKFAESLIQANADELVKRYAEFLKLQIGDTFTIVEPMGDMWKSKGNILFIRPNREQSGYIYWLKSKNFVENVQEGGNNIYKVTIKKQSDITPKKKVLKTTKAKIITPIEKRILTEEEIKIPEKSRYYIRLTGTKNEYTRENAPFVVTKGEPVFIEKGLRTFLNKDEQGYKITELETGLALGKSGRTKEEAIVNAKKSLEENREQVGDLLKQYKQVAKEIGYPYSSYISDKSKIFDAFVEKMPKKVLKKDYKTLTLAPTQAKTPSEISGELAGLFGDTPIRSIKTVKETAKGLQYKPLVNSTDIKTILSNSPEFNSNPVLIVDNEKNLVFSGQRDTFKIKATAMGLNEENLAEGDQIEIDIDALKAKGAEKQLRVYKGGSVLASFKSPQGQKTLRKIMERPSDERATEPQEVPSGFKVSERAKNILKEFGVVSGEKTLSNKYLGVYKPLTKKIRVQAFYDVTTVTHEAVHAIDDQIGFAERIIADPKGRKRNGVRKQLTEIYTKLYPGGKKTHSLKLRIKEGLAVLFENYFYDPVNTSIAYPDLVEKFVKPTGEYYDPLFGKLLDRMNSLVKDYAKLSPEEKIYSRIRTGKEVVQKDSGFTASQRFIYEIFNRFEPLKRYAKMAGVSETWEDPVIQAFNILNKNSIIFNWVKGNETPILMKDGNFKIEKGSVANYLELTKGYEKEFRSYLIARRVFESNNNVVALKNARDLEVEYAKPSSSSIELLLQAKPDLSQEQAYILATAQLREKIYAKYKDQIKKIEDIIKKDDFSVHDAEAVVTKYARKFAEAEQIYDNINKRLITLSEENGLINKETADTYRAERGYTSFRRFIDEELESVGTITSSSKSKVSSFKERTGSQLDIIDPIYSQILAINEIMGKSMENRLWQKVDDLAKKVPEISQRFEKIDPVIAVDGQGKISYPQEKDPNVIRIWVDGKRQFRKVAPEFGAIQKSLRGKEKDTFVQILRIPSSVFTRLTTSANPLFAVGNITVDQISATAQTKKGFKPVIDPAKGLVDYIKSDEAIQAYYAIGGKRQTLSAYFDLSPDDIVHRLTGGETKVEKVSGFIDSKLGILEMPSNLSEILTRFSEYKRALKSGEPMSVAMYRASEVTTPFQLQGNFGGRLGQEYIKSIPYLNAIIQVLYKFGRTAKSNPQRVATMTAGLFTVALTTAILAMRDSSDEQKRLLSEQPVRNMSRYIYFPSPNGKSLIKMRIPEQMGVFTGLAYLYTIQNYGGNKVSFDNYVDLVTSTIPEQINFLQPKKMVLSYVPQVLKPSVMVASNTKTYPDVAPIVPQFVVDRKPSEQYNAYTSNVAKTIGQLTNTSPMLIDYWVKNQFGVVGGLLIGKVPSDPINIQEKDYVMSGRSYNKFYDDRTIVKQQYDVIKNNQTNYSDIEIIEIKQKNKVYTEMSDVLSNMRKINNTVDLPADVRKMAYDVLLNIDTRSYAENLQAISPLKDKVDVIMYNNKIK